MEPCRWYGAVEPPGNTADAGSDDVPPEGHEQHTVHVPPKSQGAYLLNLKLQSRSLSQGLSAPPETVVLSLDTLPSKPAREKLSARAQSPAEMFLAACATKKLQEGNSNHSTLENIVTGGAEAVRSVWHKCGVRPHVVFVPEDIEVPAWCRHDALPTYVVRAPAPTINKLVHASYNDGFAGHFPAPLRPSPLDLVEPTSTRPRFSRVLVLYDVRVPGNTGHLLKAAKANKFDAVVLVRGAHATNEKVLRISEGAVFDPSCPIYELRQKDNQELIPILQHLSVAHRCRPVFAVPHQEAESIVSFARRHFTERQSDERVPPGLMLVVGSEHHGLESLEAGWVLEPRPQYVTLSMDNALMDSLNVVVAGSILMHALRPAADEDHKACAQQGIRMTGPTLYAEEITS